jgi:outer membrane protein OmpA-like peptidoglycan-associated protein
MIALEIEGHTDNTGNAANNLQLSESRATAVSSYLREKGISSSRITVKGFGHSNPIADNKTPAGRAKNSRVELNVK